AHPALHSFPTRRSSDLGNGQLSLVGVAWRRGFLGLGKVDRQLGPLGVGVEQPDGADEAASLGRRNLPTVHAPKGVHRVNRNSQRSEEHTSELQSRENLV